MQNLRPRDEVRAVLYAAPGQSKKLLAVEDAIRIAFPGMTRTSGIKPTRENDAIHLIVTITMREAA